MERRCIKHTAIISYIFARINMLETTELPGLASQYSEKKNIIHIILDWGVRFKHTAKTYPKYCNKIICIT